MKVLFADAAEADLEQIGDWIGNSSPIRAVTFVQELRECCDGLADMPRRYPVVLVRGRTELRRRPYGNYLILYRIVGDAIEILHVIHGARDYERLLAEEGGDEGGA